MDDKQGKTDHHSAHHRQHHFHPHHDKLEHEKMIVETASNKTIADLISDQTNKKNKEPGLRQPKPPKYAPIIKAGKGTKQSQKLKDLQRKRSSTIAKPIHGTDGERKKASIATASQSGRENSVVSVNSSDESLNQRTSVILSGENIPGRKVSADVQRRGSRGESDSNESIAHSDDWELYGGERGFMEDEESLEEREPLYEMAPVDLDIEDLQNEMNRFILDRAVAQTRITDRQKSLIADKFGLMLQALVSSQEAEVELIDNLRMKTSILNVLYTFAQAELEIGKSTTPLEDTRNKDADDGAGGILSALDGGKTDDHNFLDGSLSHANEHQETLRTEDMSASAVRETLLSQKNKLEIQENMKIIHILEIKQFEFEKLLLDMHYQKMTKPLDIQREMKELRKAVNDLRLENSTLHREILQLEHDISNDEKKMNEIGMQVDQLDLEVMTKQMAVQTQSNKPTHLGKEADRESFKLEQAQDGFEMVNKKYFECLESMRSYQSKIDSKLSELNNLARDESRMQHYNRQALQSLEMVQQEFDSYGRREQALLDRIAKTLEQTQLSIKAKKKLTEDLHRIYNDASKAHREYIKLERNFITASDAYINSKLAYEKMRSAFDWSNRNERDFGGWERLIEMFRREITKLRVTLENKLEESEYHARNVETLQKRLNHLYEEQINCGKHLQDLVRLTVRKRRERQEKSEQCIKLEAQISKLTLDKKILELVLSDCRREEYDLYRQRGVIKKNFQQIKIEKSGLVNDLLAMKQKLTEQNEKSKICQNEIESLDHQIADREKEMIRIHYLNLNAGLAVESARNEALRVIDKYQFYKKARRELKILNETFRKQIEILRAEVDKVRESFDEATKRGNETAFLVRERTEEITCILERNKAYNRIILNATAELRLKEMERTKLQTIFDEAKTHLMFVLASQPDENKFLRKVDDLRQQFKKITKERRQLELDLNVVENDDRVRAINHNWIQERENPEALLNRVNNLETQLATRELKVMERDLVLKQLDESIQTSIDHANHLKQCSADGVKKLVGMRKSLSTLSNRVEGMICEASLAIGHSDTSETEFLKLKRVVEKAENHLKADLPPSEEIEEAWVHYEWQRTQLKLAKNKPSGFHYVPKRPKGSQVIIERGRPKPRFQDPKSMTSFYNYQSQSIPNPKIPRPKTCAKKAYKQITMIQPRGPLSTININRNQSKFELTKKRMIKQMGKQGDGKKGVGLQLCEKA